MCHIVGHPLSFTGERSEGEGLSDKDEPAIPFNATLHNSTSMPLISLLKSLEQVNDCKKLDPGVVNVASSQPCPIASR